MNEKAHKQSIFSLTEGKAEGKPEGKSAGAPPFKKNIYPNQ
jgi:hypothetical protein